jgi:glucokinase
MLNQSEHENQQSLNAQELRQSLLAEFEASKQAIIELSDEQLEEVAGGRGAWRHSGRFEKAKDAAVIGGGAAFLLGVPALAVAAAKDWKGVFNGQIGK